jgi:hypothetical protein
MKIDFDARKTEHEWQKTLDKFWLSATPKWFEWLGWVLIIGAVTFVAKKTDNVVVVVVNVLSYSFFLMYFQSFFFQFEFINIPFLKKHPRVSRAVTLLVSAVLGTSVYLLLKLSIEDLSKGGA